MLIRNVALTALLLGVSAAHADVIFSDNFNADLLGLNKTSFIGGWAVGGGSVDIIGAGPGYEPGAGPGQPGDATFYNFLPGNGNYVDLDGSTREAGLFSKTLTLIGGATYTASFQLAGSHRNFTESANVVFGTTTASYSYLPMVGFTTSALTFTPLASGNYVLSFGEPGPSNNEGLLLDNVSVATVAAAVPEPSTYGLLLGGLALVGITLRRRMTR